MSPNRCVPSVLEGQTSLCAPTHFVRHVINRRRICDVLKLIHREQPASPVVPAFRCILPNHVRHLPPPIASEERTKLRTVQYFDIKKKNEKITFFNFYKQKERVHRINKNIPVGIFLSELASFGQASKTESSPSSSGPSSIVLSIYAGEL